MDLLQTKIEYLKGVGPKRAELLNKELGIFTFQDLLDYFPFRYSIFVCSKSMTTEDSFCKNTKKLKICKKAGL